VGKSQSPVIFEAEKQTKKNGGDLGVTASPGDSKESSKILTTGDAVSDGDAGE
jgi:hypothetical protein